MSLLLPSNQPLMNDPKAEDPKTQMYKIVTEFFLYHTRNLQKLAAPPFTHHETVRIPSTSPHPLPHPHTPSARDYGVRV